MALQGPGAAEQKIWCLLPAYIFYSLRVLRKFKKPIRKCFAIEIIKLTEQDTWTIYRGEKKPTFYKNGLRMYSAGIDIGSVATKGVLYNGGIAASVIIPTGWSPRESSHRALDMVLDKSGASRAELKSIIATGYGRVSADFASRAVTEITCHARGASALHPDIRTVLDIGGQDAKVICLDDRGAITDFAMNDKCAAGTGRFLEVMSRILGTEVQDLDSLAGNAETVAITSMCAVFAESEVISLMAKGATREAVARGVLESIADRAIGLLGKNSSSGPIAFTGGLSRSRVLVSIIEQRLGTTLFTSPSSQIAGALGGAVIGWS